MPPGAPLVAGDWLLQLPAFAGEAMPASERPHLQPAPVHLLQRSCLPQGAPQPRLPPLPTLLLVAWAGPASSCSHLSWMESWHLLRHAVRQWLPVPPVHQVCLSQGLRALLFVHCCPWRMTKQAHPVVGSLGLPDEICACRKEEALVMHACCRVQQGIQAAAGPGAVGSHHAEHSSR